MTLATRVHTLVAGTCFAAWVFAACAGKEVLQLGGGAATDAAGEADGHGDDHAPPTPVGTLPCGPSVCTSPQVCCAQFQVVWQCELPGQCTDVAVACDALSCGAGATCCVSVEGQDVPPTGYDGGRASGSAQCVQGATCPAGTQRACEGACPSPGDLCEGEVAPRCVPGLEDGGAVNDAGPDGA